MCITETFILSNGQIVSLMVSYLRGMNAHVHLKPPEKNIFGRSIAKEFIEVNILENSASRQSHIWLTLNQYYLNLVLGYFRG